MSRTLKDPYTRTRVITDIDPERKTRAVQSERRNSDINHIVAKAYKTGFMPVLMNRQPIPDLPDAMTYQDMLNKVVFAQQQFERLPSNIRAEFQNKPENMLNALSMSQSDPNIRKHLQSLGLLNPEQPASAPQELAKPAEPAA